MYGFQLFVPAGMRTHDLQKLLAQKLGIPVEEIETLIIEKKSLDSRNKKNIHWVYKIRFKTSSPLSAGIAECLSEVPDQKSSLTFQPADKKRRAAVIGMGPAGMFAALGAVLGGWECIIVERGKRIEERVADVNGFFKTGDLNEESNIQFGEGGAGTFSDGKLTARTKHPYYHFIIDEMINAGAPEEIRYLSKPHIGTNRLRSIIVNLRKRLISAGVRILFEERMTELIIQKDRRVRGIMTNKREILCDAVVLAAGYSAYDTLIKLKEQGVSMEPKGFAMGYRIELEQRRIDEMQYGFNHAGLPPAEFFMTKHYPDKQSSVYTFCMCPGGTVIPASSYRNSLVLNGMSNYERSGRFGNAAIVVSYPPYLWHNDTLGGVKIQRDIEKKAFIAGGGGYKAPALRVSDFCNKDISGDLPESSYPMGLTSYPVWEFYEEQYELFRDALSEFGRKMKGVAGHETMLIAPETRTSSPVRITRDDTCMSVNTPFLFPCGEGAGYAGGIITSAIDGLRVAEKINKTG